jgi:hypothetical protein
MLRKILWTKRKNVKGYWRKSRSGQLRDLYSSQNNIRAIKSRNTSWAGHVARMGNNRKAIQTFGRET